MRQNGAVTIRGEIAAARRRLREAGIRGDDADLDARLLAQEILGWDTARLLVSGLDPPPPGFADKYRALVVRRARREPLAYVTGRRDFWDLTFEISAAVLIPRPETELIVEAVLDLFPARATSLAVADVCTGSGCLAVALAHERTGARVVATDVSAAALDVARRNATRHRVVERVRFVQTDLLAAVAGTFDVIVSNPPYVREADRETLEPEVREFEPPVALFAGADGLSAIRRLIEESAARLTHHGVLALEFGAGQAESVGELISVSPQLRMREVRRDLQGIPRMAIAVRS